MTLSSVCVLHLKGFHGLGTAQRDQFPSKLCQKKKEEKKFSAGAGRAEKKNYKMGRGGNKYAVLQKDNGTLEFLHILSIILNT